MREVYLCGHEPLGVRPQRRRARSWTPPGWTCSLGNRPGRTAVQRSGLARGSSKPVTTRRNGCRKRVDGLWARRSCFRQNRLGVLVAEVFLPAVAGRRRHTLSEPLHAPSPRRAADVLKLLQSCNRLHPRAWDFIQLMRLDKPIGTFCCGRRCGHCGSPPKACPARRTCSSSSPGDPDARRRLRGQRFRRSQLRWPRAAQARPWPPVGSVRGRPGRCSPSWWD